METVIALRGLTLAYARGTERTEVLSNLDLDIADGEFVAVVGPSGVGKSTLLRVIAGLVTAERGTVTVRPPRPGRRAVALVFQDARLLPWRRVLGNVAFGLEKLSLPRATRHRRASAALAVVGLAALSRRWPFELSGGQRQRVSLARAMAVEPEILLMDEPFSALDAIMRASLQDELARLCAARRQTVLFVTHDIEEAATLADRIIVLAGNPGRIAASHTVDLPQPRDRSGATFQAIVRTVRASL